MNIKKTVSNNTYPGLLEKEVLEQQMQTLTPIRKYKQRLSIVNV